MKGLFGLGSRLRLTYSRRPSTFRQAEASRFTALPQESQVCSISRGVRLKACTGASNTKDEGAMGRSKNIDITEAAVKAAKAIDEALET